MKSFRLILEAMRRGSELANVETWKKTGVAMAILISVLTLLSEVAILQGWVGGPLTPELISELSAVIVMVVGFLLAYLQVATTKRIGVGEKKPDEEVEDSLDPGVSGAGSLPEELIKNSGAGHGRLAEGENR